MLLPKGLLRLAAAWRRDRLQQDTQVLQTLPILAGSAVTELRKNLTYLLLKKKKHDFSCNECTAFRQASQKESKPSSPAVPPRPSREPAKPFHGGLSSTLSRSTSAPRPPGQPFSTGSFAVFILAFTICLPRCLLLLQLLPGDSSTTVASFLRPPARGVPADPVCARGMVPLADRTEVHPSLWSHVVSHLA